MQKVNTDPISEVSKLNDLTSVTPLSPSYRLPSNLKLESPTATPLHFRAQNKRPYDLLQKCTSSNVDRREDGSSLMKYWYLFLAGPEGCQFAFQREECVCWTSRLYTFIRCIITQQHLSPELLLDLMTQPVNHCLSGNLAVWIKRRPFLQQPAETSGSDINHEQGQ